MSQSAHIQVHAADHKKNGTKTPNPMASIFSRNRLPDSPRLPKPTIMPAEKALNTASRLIASDRTTKTESNKTEKQIGSCVLDCSVRLNNANIFGGCT
jgi:hypothetical protein